jgi:dethiobiotin synthetase
VGKTTCACAVAAALSRRGLRVAVLKPAETGCEVAPNGALRAADAELLRFFSGSHQAPDLVCPYRLPEPLAPALAATRAGVSIDLVRLQNIAGSLSADNDVTLIEGAGGLLVPLAGRTTFADLAVDWEIPLLIVVGNRLGALNHAQLTVRHAEAVGLEVLGYIVNALSAEDDLATRTNLDTLADILGPPLGSLPWLGEIDATAAQRLRLADAAESGIDLDALLRRIGV